MRAVVQRVNHAELRITEAAETRLHTAIDAGLVVLVGIEAHDTDADLAWMARKIIGLRIFEDDAGKMNLSIEDTAFAAAPPKPGRPRPGILLVPNFTVAGRAHKGRRPDFTSAMHPSKAEPMFTALTQRMRAELKAVALETGVFGADMHVLLENDGPITIWLDSRE